MCVEDDVDVVTDEHVPLQGCCPVCVLVMKLPVLELVPVAMVVDS